MPTLYKANAHHKIVPLHPINLVNSHPEPCRKDMLTSKKYFYICLGESNSPSFTSIDLPDWKRDNLSWVFLPIGIIAPWIAVFIICWINRRAVQHPSFTRKCQTHIFIEQLSQIYLPCVSSTVRSPLHEGQVLYSPRVVICRHMQSKCSTCPQGGTANASLRSINS